MFKQIPGISNEYTVTKSGIVQGPRKILTPSKNEKGYLVVSVKDSFGTRVVRKLHRLVAFAWIFNPNPTVLTDVDHINMDKTDCRSCNLRWVDKSSNCLNNRQLGCYISHNKRNPYRARVRVAGKTVELGYFKTQVEASRIANHVRECILMLRLRALGYIEGGRSSSFC